MVKVVEWSWSRIVGAIIAGLIILGLIYWAILGIYIASVDNQNMEAISLASFQIGVLAAMIASLYYIYDPEEGWWYYGFDSWVQVVLFWFFFFFLTMMDIFILLMDIYDPVPTSTTNQNLIISLGAIQLAFAAMAFTWAIVVGIIIMIYHGFGPKVVLMHPHGATVIHSSSQHPSTLAPQRTGKVHTFSNPNAASTSSAAIASAYAGAPLSAPSYLQPGIRTRTPAVVQQPIHVQMPRAF